MRLKIVRVDQWGYNGREYHPETTDVGKVVRCVAMESWWGDDCVSMDEKIPMVNKDPKASQEVASKLRAAEGLYFIFKCVTDDDRILDLIDHEVEPVLGGKDWCGR